MLVPRTSPRRSAFVPVLLAAVAFLATDLGAQDSYTLRAGSAQVSPGGVANISVQLDSSLGSPVSGWSFGVCHDDTQLTLLSVDDGAATATANQGGPVEFSELNLYANGYAHAAVVCLSLCSPLPVGVDHEITVGHYQALGANGSSTPIDFCATLGSPPVELIVVDQGTGEFIPTTLSGSVSVVDTAISGMSCAMVGDACACAYDLTWTNGTLYDAIEVTVDGALEATLLGTDTALLLPESTLSAGGSATRTLCVTPIIAGVPGTPVCCDLACALDPAPTAGTVSASTSTGPGGECIASVSWSGFVASSPVTASVAIDGAVVMSGVPGNTAQVTLPTDGPHEICVTVTDDCGNTATACTSASCTTNPGVQFRRADSNLDGTVNVADGIFTLEVLFVGSQVLLCEDGADANDDANIDISDAIFLFGYLFVNGPPPPAPGLTCGIDPTTNDGYDCLDNGTCP